MREFGAQDLGPSGNIPAASLGPRKPCPLWKRLLDLVVSSIGVIALAPVLVVISIVIKRDSHGPVLFRQVRVGIAGSRFVMFKFRTMRIGGGDEIHREAAKRWFEGVPVNGAYKTLEDQRITRVGRFLRKTNLDEVPQLFNVLLGQMSIVGPRPAIPYELTHYKPWYFERLSVRPGMTGPWQVSQREYQSGHEMVVADIDYVRGYTLLGDLQIIARTPLAIVGLKRGRRSG